MALEFTWLLVVNLIGCFVLLAALFLGQTQIVEASSFLGLALNFFGGFILFVGACYGVFVMKNVPLPLLEIDRLYVFSRHHDVKYSTGKIVYIYRFYNSISTCSCQ